MGVGLTCVSHIATRALGVSLRRKVVSMMSCSRVQATAMKMCFLRLLPLLSCLLARSLICLLADLFSSLLVS